MHTTNNLQKIRLKFCPQQQQRRKHNEEQFGTECRLRWAQKTKIKTCKCFCGRTTTKSWPLDWSTRFWAADCGAVQASEAANNRATSTCDRRCAPLTRLQTRNNKHENNTRPLVEQRQSDEGITTSKPNIHKNEIMRTKAVQSRSGDGQPTNEGALDDGWQNQRKLHNTSTENKISWAWCTSRREIERYNKHKRMLTSVRLWRLSIN